MRSEAQRRADKKYKESGKDKYKTLGVVMHSDNINKVRETALSQNLSPSKFAARAVYYCVNNDIDLSDYNDDLRDDDEKS